MLFCDVECTVNYATNCALNLSLFFIDRRFPVDEQDICFSLDPLMLFSTAAVQF